MIYEIENEKIDRIWWDWWVYILNHANNVFELDLSFFICVSIYLLFFLKKTKPNPKKYIYYIYSF